MKQRIGRLWLFPRPPGALQVVKGVVQEGQASGLLGPGFGWLGTALEQCGPALALINTFGSPEAVRTETSLQAAVAEFVGMIRSMKKKEQFDPWCMACLRTGAALQHLAHQLLEWSAVMDDVPKYVQEINRPSEQPCAAELMALQQVSDKKRAREGGCHEFLEWKSAQQHAVTCSASRKHFAETELSEVHAHCHKRSAGWSSQGAWDARAATRLVFCLCFAPAAARYASPSDQRPRGERGTLKTRAFFLPTGVRLIVAGRSSSRQGL